MKSYHFYNTYSIILVFLILRFFCSKLEYALAFEFWWGLIFFEKKNKQQNQSINKIEMRNISSESMWKMKGLTTLLFLLNNSCVLWNNLQNSLSVFLASNWNLKRPHRSVVRIFAQTWQMIGTSFFCCCRNILFSRKQKDYFVSKTDIFFSKKTLTTLLKMILRHEFFFHKQMKTCFVWKTNSTFFGKRKNSLVRKKKKSNASKLGKQK